MQKIVSMFKTMFISLVLALALLAPLAPRAYAAEQTYSCSAYGVNSYSQNCESDGKGGWLSNAGQRRMLLYLLLSLLLISGGTALYLKTRKTSKNRRALPKHN